jgi:hypothetical protein
MNSGNGKFARLGTALPLSKGLQIGALLCNCQNPAVFYSGKSDTASLGDTGNVPGQIGLIDPVKL